MSRHVKENGGRQLLAMVPRWGWGLKGIKEKANMAKVLKVICNRGLLVMRIKTSYKANVCSSSKKGRYKEAKLAKICHIEEKLLCMHLSYILLSFHHPL